MNEHDLLNLRTGYMNLAESILSANRIQVGGLQPSTLGYERYEIRLYFTGYELGNIRAHYEQIKEDCAEE